MSSIVIPIVQTSLFCEICSILCRRIKDVLHVTVRLLSVLKDILVDLKMNPVSL